MEDSVREHIHKVRHDIKIFQLLDDAEIEQVAPYFEVVSYPAGTPIFREGDTGDFFGVVVSGRLEVKKRTELKGSQIVLALLSRGAFVGELSLASGHPHSVTVHAIEESKLIICRRDMLDSLFLEHPSIGVKILKGLNQILAIRLRKAVERLTVIF